VIEINTHCKAKPRQTAALSKIQTMFDRRSVTLADRKAPKMYGDKSRLFALTQFKLLFSLGALH
jgi:hypothetical protein